MAETNRKQLTPDYIVSTKRRFQLERSLSFQPQVPRTEVEATKDLLRQPALRKRTIVIVFCWLTSTASFLGLNYFCLELHGDVYLNFLLSAITEVLGWLVAALILRCCSRRCSYCVTCALGGVLCVTMATRRRGKSASLTLFVSTKLSISISYFVLPVWTAELLPGAIRDTGITLAEVVSLTCPVFLPLLIYQGRTIQSLPMTLIGLLQVLGGLVALGLPETRLLNFLNPPVVEGMRCDNPWSCRNCAHCQTTNRIDPMNGILRNRGPIPQSPIFSLLRGQENRAPARGAECDLVEIAGPKPIDRQLSIDELKVTVL